MKKNNIKSVTQTLLFMLSLSLLVVAAVGAVAVSIAVYGEIEKCESQ